MIKAGLVQWGMEPVDTIEEVLDGAENIIQNIRNQNIDFLLFPEYFMTSLTQISPEISESRALRQFAIYTPFLRKGFEKLAVEHQINIITGSMPELRNGELFNVGFLCRRNGETDQYEKIHIPPTERILWKLNGGSQIRAFDTDRGKIGILICYDVEFPELSRYLANQGIKILFVPYYTATEQGHYRVQYCSRARAVENECFVAICGAVEGTVKSPHLSTRYSQSAIFSPLDRRFPTDGLIAECFPNQEDILIVELDLKLLDELHHRGDVRTLTDRRPELYRQWKQ